MKLEFLGHDERYIVEQSLMTLLSAGKPTYDAVQPKMRRGAALPPRKRRRTARSQRSCTITDTPPPGHSPPPLPARILKKRASGATP